MNLRRAWSGGPSRRASGRAAASRRRRRHTPPPLSPAAIPAGGALSPRPAHPRRAAPAATRAVRARLAPLPHRRRRPLGERRHFGRVRRRGRRETQPCGGAAAAVAVSARGGDGAAHLGHSRPLSATLGARLVHGSAERLAVGEERGDLGREERCVSGHLGAQAGQGGRGGRRGHRCLASYGKEPSPEEARAACQ